MVDDVPHRSARTPRPNGNLLPRQYPRARQPCPAHRPGAGRGASLRAGPVTAADAPVGLAANVAG